MAGPAPYDCRNGAHPVTTQGDGTFTRTTIPSPAVSGQTRFALAHNGVLHNDDDLKERYHLPKTNIRTDSYVAVQLLEQDGRLDAETIGNAASLLEGTFSLSVLDQFNNLYLIKGNSPLCIYRFENGLLCYASTADILKEALNRCRFLSGSKEIIGISEGDILCIRPDGRLQMSRFDTTNLNKRLRWWNCGDYYFSSRSKTAFSRTTRGRRWTGCWKQPAIWDSSRMISSCCWRRASVRRRSRRC